MRGLLCEKLLSKTPTYGSFYTNSSLISPKSAFSTTFFKTNANAIYHQPCSEHFALSRSRLWKICSPNGVSRRFTNGIFSSSVVANTVSRGGSKFSVRIHTTRSFHSSGSWNRSWNFRRFTTDGVVLGLIMTNVAIFMLWSVADRQFMVKNFMISVDNFTSGRLHTLVTSAFGQRDLSHLIGNMIGLYFFGTSIGRTFGPQYLLKLYLSGAVVGSIFFLLYHAFVAASIQGNQMSGIDPSRVPGLGASGAVNAIMLLDIFLHPTKTVYFDLIVPVPAMLLGIIIIGQDVWRSLQGDQQVSGSAHLGGATVAALAWLQARRGRFRRF